MLALDHWHIEVSSICTLRCPRCPRLEVPESLLNKQLSLDFFENQLGEAVVKNIKKITFCGNDGDPIYCRDFLKICRWLKSVNPTISLVIITNGSYKTQQWWYELAEILDHNDEINWSLDGWDQASNEQYRVHCDWHSIIEGYLAFSRNNSLTYRVWAAIGFKFNEQQLEQMQAMARSLNFDLFQLTKSTKFGSKYPQAYGSTDPLEPSELKYVSSSFRYERELTALSDKIRPGSKLKMLFLSRAQNLKDHAALCMIGNKGVFLNSQGEFYPCCWTANRYQHNEQWLTMAEKRFNLHTRTFTEIMQDPFWTTDFLKFNSLECTTKCTRDKLQDPVHVSEW